MAHRWQVATDSIGLALGESSPQLIDQDLVDRHAELTGDAQWIHNDPARAAQEGPFGGPIAQGFLLLALLTRHSAELTYPSFGPVTMLVNYGFDRVRFIRPVMVGSQVWISASLADLRVRDATTAIIEIDVKLWSSDAATAGSTVGDVDHANDPNVAARWLFLAASA